MNKVHVEAYAYSLHKQQEELCGDRVKMISNAWGFIMVLSDGLGSGVKANILATLTTTVLSQLLIEGIELHEALETMERILPECKERKIAYSTFAILQVFYDGRAKLIEFDTPQSIWLHNGQAQPMTMETMIFGNRTIREMEFVVEIGDYVLLLSDGLLHASRGMVLNFGWDLKNIVAYVEQTLVSANPPAVVARHLLSNISELYGGLPGDDSTVGVAKIVLPQTSFVMIGPPVDPQDDEKVVHQLMQATGKKVVCGGTTAEIVSRETGLDMMHDPSIPLQQGTPGCRMVGIDLVTEGALTLGQAVSYLQEGVKSVTYLDYLLTTPAIDWGQRLVQELVTGTSHLIFMVGCSDNPANDANSLSDISVAGKLRNVKLLSEALTLLGKLVEVSYC